MSYSRLPIFLGLWLALAGLASPVAAQVTTQPFVPDNAFCATQGAVAIRGASKWQCLTPGTSGQALITQGAGALPTWNTVGGTGTVTSVGLTVPSWLAVAGSPVTGAGTLAVTANNQTANTLLAGPTSGAAAGPTFRALVAGDLPTFATGTVLSNISGATAAPSGNTLTALFDNAFSATQGTVLYRGVSGWNALAPGSTGQFLQTQGPGANPSWNAVAGANGGTVTTLTAGTNVTFSSGSTCTVTCTINSPLPTIAAGHVIGNGTGSSAAAADSTLTAILDNAISATQGTMLYRGASSWSALAPGTAGYLLKTGGSGANPSWTAPPSAGNYVLLNTLTGDCSTTTTLQDVTSFSNTYHSYKLVLDQFRTSAAASVNFQFRQSGAWVATGYSNVGFNGSGAYNDITAVSFNGSVSATGGADLWAAFGGSSGVTMSGEITTSASSAGYPSISSGFMQLPGILNIAVWAGSLNSSGGFDGIRFTSAVNLCGTIRIYGVN